jgi:hypothetical protein
MPSVQKGDVTVVYEVHGSGDRNGAGVLRGRALGVAFGW